jgi:RsiW-degrading membrane proteinase PrsW (M82 family)
MMGYHFGLARFNPEYKALHLVLAFVVPFISHGIYDFLLMGNTKFLLTIFVPVFIYFWISGFQKVSKLSNDSDLNTGSSGDQDNA